MTVLPRTSLDQITLYLRQFPVVALVGPRQVGKTTLAKTVQSLPTQEAVYLDLEKPSDLAKLSDPELYLSRYQDRMVILDEIQRLPDIFNVLRALIDMNRRPGRFLILGSAGPELLKQSAESLAGRIIYFELTGFHAWEVEDVDRLWFRGGFPCSYLADADGDAFRWLESFLATYLERDLPQLGFRIAASQMMQFWQMVAHAQGQLWNGAKIAANFGFSTQTVKRYLGMLEDTYMVRCVSPWHTNLKKRVVKTPKVYIADTGLLHVLLNIGDIDELFGHPCVGASYEGWILAQLWAVKPERAQVFFYRTHAGAEIDFLFVKGNRKLAIEVKRSLSPKPSRGLRSAMIDVGCREACVVYPGSETYPIDGQITAITLDDLKERLIQL